MKMLTLGVIVVLQTLGHLCAQDSDLSIHLDRGELIIGIENPFNIIYPQIEAITKEQVRAEFKQFITSKTRALEIIERENSLYVRPDSIGLITFFINTIDGVKTKNIRTKPMTAVARLSNCGSGYDGKIYVGEFKAQVGISARVENFDICATCKISSYEMIRINLDNEVLRTKNIGAKFEDETRAIIDNTASGDLYVFRKIFYKCPGDTADRLLEDMTFEIE